MAVSSVHFIIYLKVAAIFFHNLWTNAIGLLYEYKNKLQGLLYYEQDLATLEHLSFFFNFYRFIVVKDISMQGSMIYLVNSSCKIMSLLNPETIMKDIK